MALPIVETVDDFLTRVYNTIAPSPDHCLYAIVDKTQPRDDVEHRLAGVLSFNYTSKTNAVTEFGLMVFPTFRHSHVAANAAGLALLFALDPPSQGGLGLRRVTWAANAKNEASRRFAQKMGFELEGILRWERTFAPNRECQEGSGENAVALAVRNGTRPEDEVQGRHTAIYSVVWDKWDAKRPNVLAQMALRK